MNSALDGAVTAYARPLVRVRPPLAVVIAAGVAVAVVVAGVWIHAANGTLGTATPPFVMDLGVAVAPLWAALAVLAGAIAVLALPRILRPDTSTPAFLLAVTLAALGFGLALNAARHGPAEWSRVFDLGPGGSFEAQNEYLAGLPALSYGPRFFLDRFAELVPMLPVNVVSSAKI